MWFPTQIDAANSITTNMSIDTTTSRNIPPARILQSAYLSTLPGFTLTLSGRVAGDYLVMLYFAEIDPAVTATGQRTFDIYLNGELQTTEGPFDVFNSSGGAYSAIGYRILGKPSQEGVLLLNFTTANSSSLLAPFLAASEVFLYSNASATALSFLDDDFDNFKAKLTVKELKFNELIASTNNFETHLGTGGFGQVYRGIVDGQVAALKVASKSNHQGMKEFLNEVDLLSKVHHRNLVKLVGYCTDQNLVLIYEYMQNGSLYDCLHRDANLPPLSWDIRLKILLHASQGLDYLHNGCNPPIIHRDIKSSNILLAEDFEAKISDFGISRNDNSKMADNSRTALMGSMGYMDPDYLKTSELTEKVDVYSFGVLIFEVLSGKKAIFVDSLGKQMNLVDWVKPLIDRGSLWDLMDARMGETYNASSAWQVIEVAMACVGDTRKERPNMSAVYLELKEAQRIEAENNPGQLYDMPSMQFSGGDNYGTISFTQVSTR